MLTADINLDLNLEEYSFKSSPESYSDYSSNSPDNFSEFHSDEDLLHRLSSDLDIPLLLNSGEDDINILNSFLDKSTDEILSGMSFPHYSPHSEVNQKDGFSIEKINRNSPDLDESLCMENFNNTLSCSSNISSIKNDNPNHQMTIIKSEDINNTSCILLSDQNHIKKCVDGEYLPKKHNDRKIIMNNLKEISVEPKNVIISNAQNRKLLFVNNSKNLLVQGITSKPKVICIEKITNSPSEKLTTVSPMGNILTNHLPNVIIPATFITNKRKRSCETTINIDQPIDPKILKRQQRKIKNRESACLSRKKKRDYLISLETTVKDLTNENIQLKNENAQLKIKLAHYEDTLKSETSPLYAKFKRKVAVCMFFLVLGLNLNIFSFGVHNMGTITETNFPLPNLHSRKLLSIVENDTAGLSNITNDLITYSTCPVAINQSESARLVLELERWIGKPSNITQKTKVNFNSNTNRKFLRGKYVKKRKYIAENSIIPSLYSLGKKTGKYAIDNELQIYSHNADQIYLDFFEAINRQEDTFYVVSFSDQHMLLPALHHNRTRRPKMSLIMPTFLPKNQTHSSTVSLMQIDCEVQDTRLINVNNGAIPQYFRHAGNTTTDESRTSYRRSARKPHPKQYRMPFKPYFVNNVSHNENVEYNFN